MDSQEHNESTTTSTDETHVSDTTHSKVSSTPHGTVSNTDTKSRNIIIAVAVVAMLLVGVAYVMEKQGRIDTGIFGGVSENFSGGATVATVNDTKITQAELDVSVNQLEQAATLQGIDITTEETQADITEQALDVLVNTELLVQAAAERGLSVSDDEVEARIAQIETEVGGAEVLQERMVELGITDDGLRNDVRSEMLIDQLLEDLFTESDISVTEKEVTEIYDAAVASGADVPALDEVRQQIELQIRTSKEQEIVDQFIETQKVDADIELSI